MWVYVLYESGNIAKSTVGDDVSHTNWPLDTRLPTIPLYRDEDVAVGVYLQLKATGQPALLPVTVLNADELTEREQNDYLWYGFFFGAVSILIAFNLMLFLATHIKAYFAYVVYLGCFMVLQLSITGIGQQLFWPTLHGFTTLFALVLLAMVNAAMTYFVLHFLDIPKLFPKLTPILTTLMVVSLLPIIFLGFVDYIHVQEFQHILAVFSMVLLVGISGYCFFKGSRPGLYLLIGYCVLFVAILMTLIRVNAILDSGFFGKHLLEIAIIFEAIILALGLADRINKLQDEKQAIERAARVDQELFTQKLITAHESEKKHFGAILHDDIGHRLLNMQQIIKSLFAIDSNNTTEINQRHYLNKLDTSASELMQEVQYLAKSTHPHLLDQLGLEAAIDSLMLQSFASQGIDYSCHVSIKFHSKVIDQHLYRIAQECISNTLKHANASEVLLRIGHTSQNQLFMLYKDDGSGFYINEINQHTGFGLTSIAERVKLMGANLSWDSQVKGQCALYISNIRYDNR